MAVALVAIRSHFLETKVPPTYQELADILGISKSNARRFITILAEKGHLSVAPGRYRKFAITPRGYQAAGKAVR